MAFNPDDGAWKAAKMCKGDRESSQQVGVGEHLRCAFLLSRHLTSQEMASGHCKLWSRFPHCGATFAAGLLLPACTTKHVHFSFGASDSSLTPQAPS